MGIDEVIAEMEADELSDAKKLSPRDYAKLRSMYPQKVYAALRNKRLAWGWCDCGRKVIVVDEADKFFKVGTYAAGRQGADEAVQEEKEARGGDLDG